MKEKNLKADFEYVERNRSRFFKLYPNKYLIIFNKKVINSFDTYDTATNEAINTYGPDENFLIYHMTKKDPLNFVMQASL